MNIDNPKYNDILKTAYELFWKHGIKRVSVEEICQKANVSKMTFYRFFPNKTELGRKVLDNIINEGIEKYTEIMKRDISFEEKIRQQLILKFEGTKEISPELVADIFSNDKLGLKEHWLKRANEFTTEVRKDYADAQKQGFIRNDLNMDFIFYFNNKLAEMLSDPVLTEMYDNMQDLIMEYANLIIYGIFPRGNEKNE
jgi:AcrR family transcriptional regulator